MMEEQKENVELSKDKVNEVDQDYIGCGEDMRCLRLLRSFKYKMMCSDNGILSKMRFFSYEVSLKFNQWSSLQREEGIFNHV